MYLNSDNQGLAGQEGSSQERQIQEHSSQKSSIQGNSAKTIAIVLSGFPVVSETFIALQAAQLVKENYTVKIFNMGEMGERDFLPEGLERFITDDVVCHVGRRLDDLPLWRLLTLLFRAPIPTLRLLLLNPFPEGRKKTINRIFFLEKLRFYDAVHFQFVTVAGNCLRYKDFGFLKGQSNFLCSIRGFDVTAGKYETLVDWKLVFKYIQVFTPVCDFLSSRLSRKPFFNEKVTIRKVASPINMQKIRQRDCRGGEGLRFVSVGRLVDKKGIEVALEALAMFSGQSVTFSYTIVGDGPRYGKLKEQVRDLGLEQVVRFTGSLPSAKALDVMGENDILLAPARTAADGDCEGIPNVIKEAMYMGLQVVTTTHAGIPELVRNNYNGYSSREDDAGAFLEAINACVKNRENWGSVRRRAIDSIIEGYSPEATTGQLRRVLALLEEQSTADDSVMMHAS